MSPQERDTKPYGFAPVPSAPHSKPPIWHDGTSAEETVSGELRCELETLTPLLVGWERVPLPGAKESSLQDKITFRLADWGQLSAGAGKSLLLPLRAPWGERPVILPGDSIKGMLRHELGALMGAPMERVDERAYSYRPNQAFPKESAGRVLEPRLARVRSVDLRMLQSKEIQVPRELELFQMATRDQQVYYPRRDSGRTVPPPPSTEPYQGGMGGGVSFPRDCLSPDAASRTIHTHLDVGQLRTELTTTISPQVLDQYLRTLRQLADGEEGHFSSRHPYIGNDVKKRQKATNAIQEAAQRVMSPGDLIWVEWDTERKRVVSFGWHYYYRWAYQDTVCIRGATGERRPELSPTQEELTPQSAEDPAPSGLTAVRRLFGYTGDNDGSREIGGQRTDHSQLMASPSRALSSTTCSSLTLAIRARPTTRSWSPMATPQTTIARAAWPVARSTWIAEPRSPPRTGKIVPRTTSATSAVRWRSKRRGRAGGSASLCAFEISTRMSSSR
jgi:hypothetical protein